MAFLTSTDTTTSAIGTAYGGILGSALGQQIVWPNYNQQALQNAYGQLVQQAQTYGQGFATITPEKVFKTVKGFLAELREEIDAWHGDCLRV